MTDLIWNKDHYFRTQHRILRRDNLVIVSALVPSQICPERPIARHVNERARSWETRAKSLLQSQATCIPGSKVTALQISLVPVMGIENAAFRQNKRRR